MSRMTTQKLESFVNDHLKIELARYEKELNKINAEIMEYIELKNMCEAINVNFIDGFKTRVNIGGNMFMQAKVDNVNHVLVDVGLKHFVEFTIEEAIKFCTFKVKVLTNQADLIREQSIKTKAHIKLTLLCLGEKEKMFLDS